MSITRRGILGRLLGAAAVAPAVAPVAAKVLVNAPNVPMAASIPRLPPESAISVVPMYTCGQWAVDEIGRNRFCYRVAPHGGAHSDSQGDWFILT